MCRAKGGVLLGLPVQVGFAPLPIPRRRGKEKEKKKERGPPPHPPPTLVQFGLGLGGTRLHLAACLLSPQGPMKAH